jgi:hypothetical protein
VYDESLIAFVFVVVVVGVVVEFLLLQMGGVVFTRP